MTLKHAMNGGPIPNWVKLAGMGLMLGLQGAGVWYAQARKVDTIGDKIDVQTVEIKANTQEIKNISDYLEETVSQANVQHRQLWTAIGKERMAHDIPSKREWERHQWEWQK